MPGGEIPDWPGRETFDQSRKRGNLSIFLRVVRVHACPRWCSPTALGDLVQQPLRSKAPAGRPMLADIADLNAFARVGEDEEPARRVFVTRPNFVPIWSKVVFGRRAEVWNPPEVDGLL